MQVTCSECDKTLKVKDELAGKKIKCPGCGEPIAIPGKGAALRNGASKRSRRPADDGDAEPAEKKSSMGMILGLVGCAVLLLCLVLPAGGGVGVWFLFFRGSTPDAPGPQAKGDDPEKKKKDDAQPAAKEINVTLANPKVERLGPQFIKVSVDYAAVDFKDGDHVGVFVAFPGDAANPILVRTYNGVFLRANPKGLWEAGLNPPPPARGDLQCDIIVRTAKDASLLANGKELAKLAGVAIPPGSAGPPTVKLGNVIARQNPANSQMIDFSFECEFSGARPASNTIWFEAEFSDMVFGERKTAQLTLRVGNNIKPRETIVCSVQNPLPNSSLCNVYASDRQAGKGNLAKAEGVKIEPAEARPKAEVGLYDVRVERHEKIPNLCKISLEVKGKGAPNDTLYQCAVVFRVKGAKQTVDFGNHFLGKVLPDGVKLQGDAVTIPPGADATCEIIVREVLNRNAPPIGMLANVEVMGGVVVAGDKLVVLSNVRVSKVDDFKVHVQFNYEFTKPPDPKKWYTMMVERGDIKLKPGSTGRICFQMRGDQVQMKGEVNQRIGGPPGWGTAKSYKLWAASGENQLDAVIKESLIRTVKVSEEAPPAAKEPIQITSAAVTSLGKNGTRIDYAYKFNGDAKPNPKSMYVTYYSVKGDTPSPFYHELGLNFKAENSYSRNVPVLILTNETEIEIWIYDSVQRQIVSNKMKLDLKKK